MDWSLIFLFTPVLLQSTSIYFVGPGGRAAVTRNRVGTLGVVPFAPVSVAVDLFPGAWGVPAWVRPAFPWSFYPGRPVQTCRKELTLTPSIPLRRAARRCVQQPLPTEEALLPKAAPVLRSTNDYDFAFLVS